MHPAFSVIFFTVASGAGYGLFILMVLARLFNAEGMNGGTMLSAGILALVLISAGLLSSTFHLANPKNAWRAFFRFRTSWLSREGVFAVLFYPFALLYLLLLWVLDNQDSTLMNTIGVLALLIALATVFSTGMIYGCLKTIRQWHTALTPANYLLIGLATGGVLLVMLIMMNGGRGSSVAWLAGALLLIAAITKAVYYFWISKVIGPTINTATGFTRAQVRLLDTGHTAGTFLTDEFGYQTDPKQLESLKYMVFIFGFFLPACFMAAVFAGAGGWGSALLAALCMLGGIGVERWLFFAEARHVVNLYHGARHT
ncbi:MAG TPA: dimethyl sulfoxide reductase anchor subunit [Thiolinea sp.]|nr:dimethyl sulfoxide reductase anchor subunit [Thiolinea sp.]